MDDDLVVKIFEKLNKIDVIVNSIIKSKNNEIVLAKDYSDKELCRLYIEKYPKDGYEKYKNFCRQNYKETIL